MIDVKNLGIIPYIKGYELQKQLLESRFLDEIPDTLLVLEHNPVITIGRHGKIENVLVSEDHLKKLGIDLFYTDRGGDVTLHAPGQVVIYPIINLYERKIAIKRYIYILEEAMIQTSKDFGVNVNRDETRIGVWYENSKIGSIGVRVVKGISTHGLAFNVNIDLKNFNYIVPCGLQGVSVTSLSKLLNKQVDIEKVKESMVAKLLSMLDQ